MPFDIPYGTPIVDGKLRRDRSERDLEAQDGRGRKSRTGRGDDLVKRKVLPWKRRRITLHVAQFEPLCCDDARNLQDILEVNVGIPFIVDLPGPRPRW